jgi:hypothetical protein
LENIILTRFHGEANKHSFLCDKQFGFRPRHSTTLQLARLFETVNINIDQSRLIGAVFLDVATAFDTLWVKRLLNKLSILNSPSYLVKTTSSYLRCRTFQASFQSATPSRRSMRSGVAQGGRISPVVFRLYVNEMPAPSHHAELAFYVDDKVLVSASRKPPLLVTYLETYSTDLSIGYETGRLLSTSQRAPPCSLLRLRDESKRDMSFSGKPIQWVEPPQYLGVTFDTRLTWTAHINQAGRRAEKRLGVLGPPPKQEKRPVHEKRCAALQVAHPSYDVLRVSDLEVCCSQPRRKLQVFQSKCLCIATNAPWYVSNRQIHEDSILRRPHKSTDRVSTQSYLMQGTP